VLNLYPPLAAQVSLLYIILSFVECVHDLFHSFSETRDVTVYRLVSTGTIDEICYWRQIYKSQLKVSSVDGNVSLARIFEGVMDDPSNRGKVRQFIFNNFYNNMNEVRLLVSVLRYLFPYVFYL
jgi:hypothetical protein